MTGEQNELRTTARALYALPPAQFTAARNRAAKDLAKDASKNPAARADVAVLKRLPKASATAWAASAVAREDPELFDRLLELGQRLRDAQAALDSAALRTLAAERQRLVAEAAGRARELATQAGVAISSSALVEVSQTLQAAVTDADAAAAVRGGLLVRGLAVAGWEPVALDGAVALAADGTPAEPSRARPGRGRASDAEPAAAARERKRVEDLAWRAVDDVAVARGRVEELDGELDALASKRAELEEERAEIEEQLRGVESDLSTIYHDIQTATRNRKAAERDEARATRQAKQAKERLDRLG